MPAFCASLHEGDQRISDGLLHRIGGGTIAIILVFSAPRRCCA
jgi:hypothetical protein